MKDLITPVLVLVISTLVYSNSAMNPVLYGYLNRDFRAAYKSLFSKVPWPCKRVRAPQLHQRSYDMAELTVRDITHSNVQVTERFSTVQ